MSKGGSWVVEPGTGKLIPKDQYYADKYGRGQGLQIIPDLPDYMSPLGNGVISGRRARREEMARHNVREVDPGEFKFKPRNERFCRKWGIPFEPD